MIHIQKKREPKAFTKYRLSAGATYDGMDSGVKSELIKSLIEEQGWLCAYCMSRIECDNARIEHFLPQSKYPDLQLEYSNLLAVCQGQEKHGEKMRESEKTCDAKKENKIILINPLQEKTLKDIKYTHEGIIESSSYHEDINDTLNLNCQDACLPINRKKRLESFEKWLNEKYIHKEAPKDKLMDLYEYHKNLERKEPFIGIVLCYLEKKLKL